MNDSAILLTALLRASIVVSLSMLAVTVLIRLLKVTSPAAHRMAYCLVILQGWLIVRPTMELPWLERRPTVQVAGDQPTDFAPQATDTTRVTVPAGDIMVPSATDLANAANASRRPDAARTTLAVADGASLGPQLPMALRTGRAAWSDGMLAVWLAGAIATLMFFLLSYVRFLRNTGRERAIRETWLDEWRQVLLERRLDRCIELRVTAKTGPLVCWTPRGYRIVVPERLWNDLSRPQRLAVLRHELAHVQRGDLWKSLLIRALASLHWFNPFAWWAARRFDEAAEWACDAMAPRSACDRVEYAKVLLRLCQPGALRPSLAAAIGGRATATRIRRVVQPSAKEDALFKKFALASCAIVLLVATWVRFEFVARAQADEPAPATRTAAKSPEAVDISSLIDVLAQHEAQFATFHIEYVSVDRRDDDDVAAESEERVEFARDAQAGRWFRRATTLTGGVRTQQDERYTDHKNKRIISSLQTNWNGLNPPHVAIDEPRPEPPDGYDAEPLFGLFPNSKPLSEQLKGLRVSVELVEGDAILRWTTTAGPFTTKYEARLSHEHGLLPIELQYTVDGPIDVAQTKQWRATQIKQSGDVWYAAEGEFIETHRKTHHRFKVAHFALNQPIPDEAMRYAIPAGARVDDRIAKKRYVQARPVAGETKPFSVTVLDVGGRPIEGASVKISLSQSSREQAGKAPQTQVTNDNGVAHFEAAPDDMIHVEVSKHDMRPAAIISGGGNQLRLYLTPRTKGRVFDIDGRKPRDGYVVVPTFGLDMSGGALKPRPAFDRDSCTISPDGAFEFTKELTLRRIDLPLLFVAYAEQGQRMAIRTIMPDELSDPLDFLLEPAVSVTAELQLPPGTPPSTRIEAIWTDATGLMIGSSSVTRNGDHGEGALRGTAVGRLPPGEYQLQVRATSETEKLVFEFAIGADQSEAALGVVPLRPSRFASLRGKPAPELVGTPIEPSELTPLSSLRGKIVVLNFWHLYPDQFNFHPEQTPFFTLPAHFKDAPVHWIAIHDHAVSDADRLAAKVAEMRKARWGDGPAPFTAMVDAAEPIPDGERGEEARRATDGGRPGTTRGVTGTRYGVFGRLVLIDRQGRVVGSYEQEELEPALRRLLDAGD